MMERGASQLTRATGLRHLGRTKQLSRMSCGLELSHMDHLFARISSRMSAWAGQPIAFILAALTIITWVVSGPIFHWSDTWQLVINTGTTIVTFLMVFLIQNGQNRDASAMQVKLDELIRAVENARNVYIGIEHLTDVEICRIRDDLEKDQDADPDVREERSRDLQRLITRR